MWTDPSEAPLSHHETSLSWDIHLQQLTSAGQALLADMGTEDVICSDTGWRHTIQPELVFIWKCASQ